MSSLLPLDTDPEVDMLLPYPELPRFDYTRAQSVEQAVELLQGGSGETRLLMGGTDMFLQLRDGRVQAKALLDVKNLPDMQSVKYDPKLGLRIGAATNMNVIAKQPAVLEHYPILVEAIHSVASYQLRNRATMGGNLCNASPAADTAPAALVLEAILQVAGPKGERSIPIGEFFLGPGQSALQPGELLTRIDLPQPPKGAAGRYLKLGRNAGGDLAIVGVAVMGYPDPALESKVRFRIALASVAPTPLRVDKAEQILAENPLSVDTVETAALAAEEAAKPIDDVRASARYRKAMVKALTRRGLRQVCEMLGKEC
jgi:carbon-monoxide dehydrogenase medium subunit